MGRVHYCPRPSTERSSRPLSTMLLLLLVPAILAQTSSPCCPVKEVKGSDGLQGTYRLATAGQNDVFPDICMDSCPYLKDGNSNPTQLFCFKTEGATHVTDCREGGTTPGGGGCDYPKDNVSWGEYQTKIPMPASASSPYDVVVTFDAETTIGSCHSNCGPITCSGSVCEVAYTGSIPLNFFNVKKVGGSGEDDRSNIIQVQVNQQKLC